MGLLKEKLTYALSINKKVVAIPIAGILIMLFSHIYEIEILFIFGISLLCGYLIIGFIYLLYLCKFKEKELKEILTIKEESKEKENE